MLIGTASSLWNTFSFLYPWLSLLKSSPFWRSQKAMLLTGSVAFFTATDQTLFLLWASSDQLRSILAHQTALILVPNHSVLIFLLQFTPSFLLFRLLSELSPHINYCSFVSASHLFHFAMVILPPLKCSGSRRIHTHVLWNETSFKSPLIVREDIFRGIRCSNSIYTLRVYRQNL